MEGGLQRSPLRRVQAGEHTEYYGTMSSSSNDRLFAPPNGEALNTFYRAVSDSDVLPNDVSPGDLVQLVDSLPGPSQSVMDQGQSMRPTGREQTEKRTMLIIRNIPCKVTRAQLQETLNALGYAGKYAFTNLPTKRNGKHGAESNVGYAFVNFLSPDVAHGFKIEFEGYKFPDIRSGKACSVEYANDQRGRGQGLQSTNPLSLQAPEAVEVPLVTKWCLSFQ
eukprot:TRINITY_DN17192_c0_g2_i1.p1 TRINITY_DN17192_c0_g2~~TRINITY_DN17192_c0_g2_i1.p1  ORF type:complete len:222 (+),score=14.01 TRINITY_DN17192_c0_g2_i1:44-709(+)